MQIARWVAAAVRKSLAEALSRTEVQPLDHWDWEAQPEFEMLGAQLVVAAATTAVGLGPQLKTMGQVGLLVAEEVPLILIPLLPPLSPTPKVSLLPLETAQ